jgi:hypothetical protein
MAENTEADAKASALAEKALELVHSGQTEVLSKKKRI